MTTPFISAILLAGGIGTRMQGLMPKQFLLLKGKPVARHSFDLLMDQAEINEIIVVCDPQYRHHFEQENLPKRVAFALPGARRQDSVYHGLQEVSSHCHYVCIHDSARPLIHREMILRVLKGAEQHGAATVGMPVKFTVKESDGQDIVHKTPDRSLLWEIQTPQVVRHSLLHEGFKHAIANHLTVMDDVSLVELLNNKVKLVEGSATNLKITVPSDLAIADLLLNE